MQGPNGGYTFSNLAPGDYQLRVKDANGCESAIVTKTLQTQRNCPLSPLTLYGETTEGGTSDKGVLFSFNLQSNDYKKLKDFNGPE